MFSLLHREFLVSTQIMARNYYNMKSKKVYAYGRLLMAFRPFFRHSKYLCWFEPRCARWMSINLLLIHCICPRIFSPIFNILTLQLHQIFAHALLSVLIAHSICYSHDKLQRPWLQFLRLQCLLCSSWFVLWHSFSLIHCCLLIQLMFIEELSDNVQMVQSGNALHLD